MPMKKSTDTFRFVAQCLNQLRHRGPPAEMRYMIISSMHFVYTFMVSHTVSPFYFPFIIYFGCMQNLPGSVNVLFLHVSV
jgi:hypothetical protein